MVEKIRKKQLSIKLICVMILILVLGACANEHVETSGDNERKLTDVKFVLDWAPNTNHTGVYVAQALGYYEAEGLRVGIELPGVSGSIAIVGSDEIPFGISHQENVTEARAQGVPIVSIAAIMQHNTSAFAAPKHKGITRPQHFEGKTYGGFSTPAEAAVIQSLMTADEADANKVTMLNLGQTDYFTAFERDIDFSWIFYGWTGIEAELRNIDLDLIYLTDYSESLDYYTPVVITNEKTIAQRPELVTAFMAATAKGYQYAIDHPEESARILLDAEPELDEELVLASQQWLSPRYQDDAPQWGVQQLAVWERYAQWMQEYELLSDEFDAEAAFTNDYLPAVP